MKTLEQFISSACEGSGVQNDSSYVWVEVDGAQFTVPIDDVLDHEETEPFEASAHLENNLDAPAWEALYCKYCDRCSEE